MNKTLVLMTAVLMAGSLTVAYAANVDKGKALFESPTLGGGTTGKSCVTCHPGGKNLSPDLAEKGNLAEFVNMCIERPLGGKAIAVDGEEMQDLIAYMKSLVAKPAKKKTPKKVEGC
ncbi:MAG: hypothetical protein KKD63_15785 [Proteobacteria bacterium]|nr:hypothetical protein [Desulfobulbaceae bacterium]MBU4154330.1 hypothetical protein [Pseudomonadota bacterium]MDP2106936.1 hypothetical protein [Desulfobulbaceae bacterium]